MPTSASAAASACPGFPATQVLQASASWPVALDRGIVGATPQPNSIAGVAERPGASSGLKPAKSESALESPSSTTRPGIWPVEPPSAEAVGAVEGPALGVPGANCAMPQTVGGDGPHHQKRRREQDRQGSRGRDGDGPPHGRCHPLQRPCRMGNSTNLYDSPIRPSSPPAGLPATAGTTGQFAPD